MKSALGDPLLGLLYRPPLPDRRPLMPTTVFTPKGSYLMGRPEYSGKLSREDVLEVVRRYEAGDSIASIARTFGVVSSAIHYQVSKRCVLRRDRLEHGTRRCFERGCRLAECREAANTYMREYQRAKASRRKAREALAVSA